jgi:WD40 repeat protein
LRKLSELPYQQARGELWEDAFDTLTDFAFLESKATECGVVQRADGATAHTGVYQIEEDCRRVLLAQPPVGGEALADLLAALTSCAHHLENEPAALAALVHNLLSNDCGEASAAAPVLARARAHLSGRNWLRLGSRGAPQIRHALARVLTHGAPVRAVAWARRGDLVVSAADDVVKVWDVRTGALLASHSWGGTPLHAVALSPDGSCLAVGTDEGLVLFARPREPSGQRTLVAARSPVACLAWSPAGDLLAYAEGWSVKLVAVRDGAGAPAGTLSSDLEFQPPHFLRWSPQGDVLLGGCRFGWRLWRLRDGSLTRHRTSAPVTAIDWSRSGDALALALAVARPGRMQRGREQGVVDLLAPDGALIRRLDLASGPVRALAWSPAGSTLATASMNERTIGVYGVGMGMDVSDLVGLLKGDAAPVAAEDLILLWDARTGQRGGVLRGHRLPVAALDWSADGAHLASGSEDGTVWLWQAGAKKPDDLALGQGHLDRIRAAAICPGGSTFATVSDDTTVRFWDFAGHAPMVVEKGEFAITAFAWAPESQYDLVVADRGRRVGRIARTDEGWFRRSVRVRNLISGTLARLPGSSFVVGVLAWSPCGELLAAGGDRLAVWDVPMGRCLVKLRPAAPVTALAWSDDGRRLAWAERGGRVLICDRAPQWRPAALPARRASGTALLWWDGRLLAAGGEDGAIVLWNVEAADPCWEARPARSAVTCLGRQRDGPLLVAGFGDTGLRLLDGASGRTESVVFVPSPVLCLRAGQATVDVVDDGTAQGARPGAYSFVLEPARPGHGEGEGHGGLDGP